MNNTNPSATLPSDLRPFPPSWIDQMIDGLERRSLPTWASLLLLYAGIAAFYHAVFWIEGLLPPGQVNPEIAFNAIWIPAGLGFVAYLDRAAAQSWRQFRPALGGDVGDLETFAYRLTTMPRWKTAATMLPGPLVLALTVRTEAESYLLITPGLSTPASALLMLVLSISFGMLPMLAYHTIRQLNLVGQVHQRVTEIDLYDLRPTFAFSGLSARTGIMLILLLNLNIANTQIRTSGAGGLTGTDALVIGLEIVLAVLAFVLPLWGIHRKLTDAKANALTLVKGQLKQVHDEVNQHVKRNNLNTSEDLERTEAMLRRQHDLLKDISTWPWDPETLRGFVSAMVLPILLWLVQQLLARSLLAP